MKATNCDECKHFSYDDGPNASGCEENHKLRWYAHKDDNPYNTDYGYKRRCDDYVAAPRGRTIPRALIVDIKHELIRN